PASGAYRDYHGRTRYDLKPWSIAGDTYDAGRAAELAREHASSFLADVGERLDAYAAERGREGLVCCALDTELLGHWWYEGPTWLAAAIVAGPGAGAALRRGFAA